jgi:transcriptional regulator with XRE-family HTH domain
MSKQSVASPAFAASPESEVERRVQIGAFFRQRRLGADLSMEMVAKELELESPEVLLAYETGKVSIPVDDIFALTNLLNVPPEDVMELVHELYLFGAD